MPFLVVLSAELRKWVRHESTSRDDRNITYYYPATLLNFLELTILPCCGDFHKYDKICVLDTGGVRAGSTGSVEPIIF